MARTAAGTPLQEFSNALSALAASAAPSVVSIDGHRTRASGFVWRPGWIVTADEALGDAEEFTVTFAGGETRAATIRGRDPSTDIALLKVDEGPGTPATFDDDAAVPGALVLAAGSAGGAPLVALGAVSHAGKAWKSMRGGRIDARVELDIRLPRRAEGGLALGTNGKAIGITVFGPRRRALVIPATTVERVATRLMEHGRIARGYLGVGLQPVSVAEHEGAAAMIVSVDPAGPAAKAGILQGDIVLSVGGEPMGRMRDLTAALGPDSVGTAVTLGLRRAGASHSVSVTIGERPAA